MNMYRIAAVSWRHLAFLFHPSCLLDIFFWASFDVVLFGFTGAQFARTVPTDQYMACAFVVALLAFRCLTSATGNFMTNSFLRELGDRNFVALYTSPLCLNEWLIAGFIVGTTAAFVRLSFAVLGMICILNVCMHIPLRFALIGALYLSIFGWASGLLMVSVSLLVGRTAQAWIWIVLQISFLLSGVLCPLNLLPVWLRFLSRMLPLPYLFDGLRNLFIGGSVWPQLLVCGALDLLYFVCAYALVHWLFAVCKQRGLAQLEQS